MQSLTQDWNAPLDILESLGVHWPVLESELWMALMAKYPQLRGFVSAVTAAHVQAPLA